MIPPENDTFIERDFIFCFDFLYIIIYCLGVELKIKYLHILLFNVQLKIKLRDIFIIYFTDDGLKL